MTETLVGIVSRKDNKPITQEDIEFLRHEISVDVLEIQDRQIKPTFFVRDYVESKKPTSVEFEVKYSPGVKDNDVRAAYMGFLDDVHVCTPYKISEPHLFSEEDTE